MNSDIAKQLFEMADQPYYATRADLLRSAAHKIVEAERERLSEEDKTNIKVVVEAFWEYESGWGATANDKQAAVAVQKIAGYTTEWDHLREKSSKSDSK